jgi:hypothetical protein
MGILSVSMGRAQQEHGSHVAAMTLRALGLADDEAHESAHRALPPLPED